VRKHFAADTESVLVTDWFNIFICMFLVAVSIQILTYLHILFCCLHVVNFTVKLRKCKLSNVQISQFCIYYLVACASPILRNCHRSTECWNFLSLTHTVCKKIVLLSLLRGGLNRLMPSAEATVMGPVHIPKVPVDLIATFFDSQK